jgi:hypothetical protein
MKRYSFIYKFLNYKITFSFKIGSYLVSRCYNFWFFGTEMIVIEGLTYRKDCALCWDVYIICICNVVISSDYCVTIRNELSATFASLVSEVPSARNSVELQVNESFKFRIGASNHWPSACNNCPSACNNWPSAWNDWPSAWNNWQSACNSWPSAWNNWQEEGWDCRGISYMSHAL